MRGVRLARSSTSGSDRASRTLVLAVDEDGLARVRSSGDACRTLLAGVHEGVPLDQALSTIHPRLACGLAEAVRDHRPCSGRTVIGSGVRAPYVLSYEVLERGSDSGPEIVLTIEVCEENDTVAELAAEQTRWAASTDALVLLSPVAGRDGGAALALPQIVRATGMQTGAVFAGGGREPARLLTAFGPTSKRGYPYPDLALDSGSLRPLHDGSPWLVLARGAVDDGAMLAVVPLRARWLLVAPVRSGDLVTGVVVLGTSHSKPPSLGAGEVLRVFADALGLALGAVALSHESDQSEAVLETAAAVARAISGSLDLDETFRQIAVGASQVMGGCRCLVLQAQDDPREFVTVASSEPGDAPLLGLRVAFEDEQDASATLVERRSIVVENLVFGAGTDHSLRSCLQMRSALFVPVTSEGRPIGSLLFCSRWAASGGSASDIARAETVAEQAASAICNARLFGDLERSRAEAQSLLRRITGLRERQRLEFASVVHDDIIQSVVAALYELEALRRTLTGDEAVALDRASELLRGSIGEARRYIHDLRPPVLDELGLTGALQLLAERCEKAGVHMTIQIEEIEGLSPAATTALYMVAREALQNARRHAGASRIELSLGVGCGQTPGARDGAMAVLSVSDDGCGVEGLPAGEEDEHFGLTMMDEQTAMAGGRLRVTSAPGEGTRIEAEVPCSSVSE